MAPAVPSLCLNVYNQCKHQKELKDDLEDIAEFVRRVGVSVSKGGTKLDWTALEEKIKEVSQRVQKITSRDRLWAFLYAKADRDKIEELKEEIKTMMQDANFEVNLEIARKIDETGESLRAEIGDIKKLLKDTSLQAKVAKHLGIKDISNELSKLSKIQEDESKIKEGGGDMQSNQERIISRLDEIQHNPQQKAHLKQLVDPLHPQGALTLGEVTPTTGGNKFVEDLKDTDDSTAASSGLEMVEMNEMHSVLCSNTSGAAHASSGAPPIASPSALHAESRLRPTADIIHAVTQKQWVCISERGVGFRNTTSLKDRYTDIRGPNYNDKIMVLREYIGSDKNWLEVDVVGHGTKYLPIDKPGMILCEPVMRGLKMMEFVQSDASPLCLSGTWTGESISCKNNPTRWAKTQIEFVLGADGRHGTITGKGISLWGSMRIDFTVSGTFDWETLEVSLVKQHIGRYANAVEYTGVILPDRRAIVGHYQNGLLSLRKIDELHRSGPNHKAVLSSSCRQGGKSMSRSHDTWPSSSGTVDCSSGKCFSRPSTIPLGANDASVKQMRDRFSFNETMQGKPCHHEYAKGFDPSKCASCGQHLGEDRASAELAYAERAREADRAAQLSDIPHSVMQHSCGVRIDWLLAFTFDHDCWDWPTWRVNRDIIKPATRMNRDRYAHLPDVRIFTGPAQVFVSHSWGAKWGDLVLAACDGAQMDRRVWIDLFAVRQWPGREADLDFPSVITKCKALLLVMSMNPELASSDVLGWDFLATESGAEFQRENALFRLWCIAEVSAAIVSNVPLLVKCGYAHVADELTQPPSNYMGGFKTFKYETSGCEQMLRNLSRSNVVRCENARCSERVDFIREMKAIRSMKGGCAKINTMVNDALREAYETARLHLPGLDAVLCGELCGQSSTNEASKVFELAATGDHVELIGQLIQSISQRVGEEEMRRAVDTSNAVKIAVRLRHQKVLRLLLEISRCKGRFPEDFQYHEGFSLTSLSLLLQQGAPVDYFAGKSYGPIHLAVATTVDKDVIRVLCQHGASIDSLTKRTFPFGMADLDTLSSLGGGRHQRCCSKANGLWSQSPHAGQCDWMNPTSRFSSGNDCLVMIRNWGEEKNTGSPVDETFPLRIVCERIINNGLNNEWWSSKPLQDLLLFLLEMGADPNQASSLGITALHAICMSGSPSFVQRKGMRDMLDFGANINAVTVHWHTPLWFAALYSNFVFVEALLARGADPDVVPNLQHSFCLDIGDVANQRSANMIVSPGTLDTLRMQTTDVNSKITDLLEHRSDKNIRRVANLMNTNARILVHMICLSFLSPFVLVFVFFIQYSMSEVNSTCAEDYHTHHNTTIRPPANATETRNLCAYQKQAKPTSNDIVTSHCVFPQLRDRIDTPTMWLFPALCIITTFFVTLPVAFCYFKRFALLQEAKRKRFTNNSHLNTKFKWEPICPCFIKQCGNLFVILPCCLCLLYVFYLYGLHLVPTENSLLSGQITFLKYMQSSLHQVRIWVVIWTVIYFILPVNCIVMMTTFMSLFFILIMPFPYMESSCYGFDDRQDLESIVNSIPKSIAADIVAQCSESPCIF